MSIRQQVNTGNAQVPGCQQSERCSILHVDFLDHLQLSLNLDLELSLGQERHDFARCWPLLQY